MENHFRFEKESAVIEVPYKGEIVDFFIDKEDIETASSIPGRWILIRKSEDLSVFYLVSNQDHSILLHRLIANASKKDKIFFKDKDHRNLRKENLSVNTYEAGESMRENLRVAWRHMSKESKENIVKGMRERRYTKDYSDKLSATKLGKKNPVTKLDEKIVRTIREEYALRKASQEQLGKRYGVGRTTIGDIVNYRTWNEIGEDKNKIYRVFSEDNTFIVDLDETPIQEYLFTNEDILQREFLIHFKGMHAEEFIFVQKIGKIKLYVEVRNENKEFYHSFEVVFPEFLTPQNIHNYVITHRKPKRYMNRHRIHSYMTIISTFLFGVPYDMNTKTKY